MKRKYGVIQNGSPYGPTTVTLETQFRNEDGLLRCNRDEMPLLGFGTYKVGSIPASATGAGGAQPKLRPALEVLKDAAEAGYKMFDCAQFYENEESIGAALKSAKGAGWKPFLISKVWGDRIFEGPEAVVKQFEKTCTDLDVVTVDLYLIHWPVPQKKHIEAYKALQTLVVRGKVRHLGLSNYSVEDYMELMEDPDVYIKPVMNQIEINPALYRTKTLHFFRSQGVHMQAYRGLGTGGLLKNPTVAKIAERHGKKPSQVLGRWLVQQGISHVPKSESIHRMQENAALFDFSLTLEDFRELGALTTPENIAKHKETYEKCRVRDTPVPRSAGREHYTAD